MCGNVAIYHCVVLLDRAVIHILFYWICRIFVSCLDKQALRWWQPPSQKYRFLTIRLHHTINTKRHTSYVSLLMVQTKKRLRESLCTIPTLHVMSTVWYSALCFAKNVFTARQFPLWCPMVCTFILPNHVCSFSVGISQTLNAQLKA